MRCGDEGSIGASGAAGAKMERAVISEVGYGRARRACRSWKKHQGRLKGFPLRVTWRARTEGLTRGRKPVLEVAFSTASPLFCLKSRFVDHAAKEAPRLHFEKE